METKSLSALLLLTPSLGAGVVTWAFLTRIFTDSRRYPWTPPGLNCSDSGHVGPTWHWSRRNVTPILQRWGKTSHLEPRSVEWPVPAKQWPVSGHGGLTPGMSHTVSPRCYRMSCVPLVPQLTGLLNDFYWMVTTK